MWWSQGCGTVSWNSTRVHKILLFMCEDTLIWRRKLWIALCGELALEEALDLSEDRLLKEWIFLSGGPGSVVGIATGYGLGGPVIESRWGRDFPHLTRPALGPTQPPVQWVPILSGGLKRGQGVTMTPHLFLVPWSRKGRTIPLLPLLAVRPYRASVPVQIDISLRPPGNHLAHFHQIQGLIL
jgi:hypothetical protein